MTHLPVDDVLPALHEALDRGPAVLHAPTGAGKTTRVPPALLDRVAGRVLVLEPRRVAARAAARRMAAERREKVGQTVGYRVRLDDRSGPATRLLVITDGILLGMLHSDPLLDGVDAVVFDEFHERRLDCDLALALMKELRELRPELLLVVMSATLDAEPVSRWLDGTVVRSSGRLHPVDTQYLPHASAAPLPTQVASAIRRALDKADGDILAFLPGVREIHRTATALGAVAGWEVLPLHGRLPAAEQDRAMAAGGRRIVLATNVAETSVTLPGVTTVVDAGWVKRLRVDPSTGLDRLVTERISKASADQRAGRAGRVRPGRCSRLWTAREHAQLAPFEEPEIRRVDLCGAALHVLRWGTAPDRLAWFEAPPPASLAGALTTLQELGLIDGGLTELGAVVARIPAHPRIARMLVEAHATGALPQAAAVAALLSDRDPVGRCPATHTSASDLADRADHVADLPAGHPLRRLAVQLERSVCRAVGRPGSRSDTPIEALGRAVLAGWPDRIALRRADSDDRLLLVGGRGARLGRGSAVRNAELLVAVAVDDGDSEAVVHLASEVQREWLQTEARVVARWDADGGRAGAVRQVRYRDLVLSEHTISGEPALLSAILAERAAERDPAEWLPDDPELTRLCDRVRFVRRHRPELGLPDTGPDGLRALLPTLARRRRSLDDLRRAPWRDAILGELDWRQRPALDRLAPDRLDVPSGNRVRLDYPVDGPPILAVRIQEVFGWQDTPRILDGAIPVRLHLLAPNRRPAQITDDLRSFWTGSYAAVRRDLRGRYPKHSWPEDPLTARAEHRPRRRR